MRSNCVRTSVRLTSNTLACSLLVLCALSPLRADEPTAADSAAQTPQSAGVEIDFREEVLPILQANCIACHNRTNPESDLVLESAEAMLKGGSLGPAIDLEAPDSSLLLQLASHREEPVMPPEDNDVGARKLTAEELKVLHNWIAAGARMSSANSTVLNWQPINSALVAVYALETDWAGRFIAAGRGNRVTVYDHAVGDRAEELIDPALKALVPADAAGVAHRDFVQAIAAHPDGSQIATAGYQVIKLWRRRLHGSPVPLPATSTPAVALAVQQRRQPGIGRQ